MLRGLSLWYVAIVGAIAIIIDYISMHSGLYLLHFDVPEVPEYFISKFAIVSLATIIAIKTFGYKLKALALAAVGGSSVFSLYYLITRPSIFGPGLYPSQAEYHIYDLQTSVVIWLVHAFAIGAGFMIVKMWMKTRSHSSGA